MALTMPVLGQTQWREATTAEMAAGTAGTPVAVTPRRLGALPPDTAAGLSSNAVVQSVPFIQMFPNGNIRIWDGTNSFPTNFPASTTFGFNEVQNMFPWQTNGLWSGGKIMMAAGEYDFTTPIWITNNWTIEGAGHLSTVWVYTGPTNGFTIAAMTNAVGNNASSYSHLALLQQQSLVVIPTNRPSPVGEFLNAAPNVILQGFSIKAATNFPAVILLSRANTLKMNDIGIGGPAYLQASNGAYHVGYLDRSDLTNAPALIGLWMAGDGQHNLEKSDFGGLADSIVLDSDGWNTIKDCTLHVAGQFKYANTNMYPTNAAAYQLGAGFHIWTKVSYTTIIDGNFYDEANYDLYGNDISGSAVAQYNINSMEQAVVHTTLSSEEQGQVIFDNNNLITYFGFAGVALPNIIVHNVGSVAINGNVSSDYVGDEVNPGVWSDGFGNHHALTYNGNLNGNVNGNVTGNVSGGNVSGNGSGLTSIATTVTNNSFYNSTTATNVVVFTVPSSVTNSYEIGGYVNVTALSIDVVNFQVLFTDEKGASQTIAADANITATGFNTVSAQGIRAKGGTTITLKGNLVTGTGSITYDIGGWIKPIL